jgi:hypothetical protein
VTLSTNAGTAWQILFPNRDLLHPGPRETSLNIASRPGAVLYFSATNANSATASTVLLK